MTTLKSFALDRRAIGGSMAGESRELPSNSTEKVDKPNFWTTLPGILTGIAALITAAGGIIIGLH
jgi:hypothetical protein